MMIMMIDTDTGSGEPWNRELNAGTKSADVSDH